MLRESKTMTGGFMAAALTAALLILPATARAQEQSARPDAEMAKSVTTAAPESARPAAPGKTAAPIFDDYKGVTLGMAADDVRQTLGKLKEKGDEQDFFVFSDGETAQVFYDSDGKVKAVAVSYFGEKVDAPTPIEVFGAEVKAKDDGSLYNIERYPNAGYWVSYNRTAGDSPLITITMNKLP